jgi:hypothetical protein
MNLNPFKHYTLADLANRVDPKGDTAVIAELLNKANPILLDAPFTEANDIMSYQIVQRISLPKGQIRQINKGIGQEAAHEKIVREHIGMLESYSEVDMALVDNHPSPEAFRMISSRAHIEGMGQTLAQNMIYGNPEGKENLLTGLQPRLNKTSQANVFDAGGKVGKLSSVYIVQWGVGQVSMFYPKTHTKAGIEHSDLGRVTLTDSEGKKYEGYRDHYKAHCGLAVWNPQCIARIANIKPDAKPGEAGYMSEDLLITALNYMYMDGTGAVIYMSRGVKTASEIRMKDKGNIFYSPSNGEGLAGSALMSFRGVPVRVVDAISENEPEVLV